MAVVEGGFCRHHALGVAVLCKQPPVVLGLVEANGWWVWSSHPRAAYMDHAKRTVLHLLYTMRDAAFDCDEEDWSDEARACFLMHEHRRMVTVAEDMLQALGDLWFAYGGEANFACAIGVDGSTHTPAVEVLAQTLPGALEGLRWNRKRFHERAAQRTCLDYVKCLGLVLVELRLLPRSMRYMLLPSPGPCRVCAIDHDSEELIELFRRRDTRTEGFPGVTARYRERQPRWRCWGELLFEYAQCVLVCYREDIAPQRRPLALKYAVFVSREAQRGLRAIRYLMAAAETQRLHGERTHRVKSAFGHWKQVSDALAPPAATVSEVLGAIADEIQQQYGFTVPEDAVHMRVRIGAPVHERMSMLLRTAVGGATHYERPPTAMCTADARSNRPGRLDVVHRLSEQAGLPPFVRRCVPGKAGGAGLYTDFDGCCWPLITRAKSSLTADDAVLSMV